MFHLKRAPLTEAERDARDLHILALFDSLTDYTPQERYAEIAWAMGVAPDVVETIVTEAADE